MFRWIKLAKRVSELEEGLLRLTRVVGDRDLDWADMRARCKRLLDRTEKAARTGVQSPEPTDHEEAGNGAEAIPSGFLTPRQKTIQQQILKRRGGL